MVTTLQDLRSAFQNPSEFYGNCPWYQWDGDMRPEEIEFQMEKLHEQGIRRFMLAPMHTLELPFPERPWFEAVLVACRKARDLGMKLRIWDEYNWPTGNAGGKVVQVDPDYAYRTARVVHRTAAPGQPVQFTVGPRSHLDRVIAGRVEGGEVNPATLANLTHKCRDGVFHWEPEAGNWAVVACMPRPAFGEPPCHLDSFNPDAVQCFIELVLERYREYCGPYFGNVIEGFFHDEARHIRFSGDKSHLRDPEMVWGKQFWEKLGYGNDAQRDRVLMALMENCGGATARIRVDHWGRVARCYGETFFKPLADWAEAHGVEYSGHTFEQDQLILLNLSDYYETMKHQQIPGVDILRAPHNLIRQHRRTIKTGASLAKTTGRRTSFVEGPGCMDWQTTYEKLKWSTDWLLSAGIGMQMPNSVAYTIAHRQHWAEGSLGYQWSLFEGLETYERYVRRVYQAMDQGNHVVDIGVLYPTQTYQANFVPYCPAEGEGKGGIRTEQGKLALEGMDSVCGQLAENGHDYEYIYPQVLLEGEVTNDGRVRMGHESFSVLIVPPTSIVMPGVTEKMDAFLRAGGRLVFCGLVPEQAVTAEATSRVREQLAVWLGRDPQTLNELVQTGSTPAVSPGRNVAYVPVVPGANELLPDLLEVLEPFTPNRIRIDGPHQRREFSFYHKRGRGWDLFFLANMADRGARFEISVPARGYPELWDPLTGGNLDADFDIRGDRLVMTREWAPRQSLLLAVDTSRKLSTPMLAPRFETIGELALDPAWRFELLTPNVLPVREARWSQAVSESRRLQNAREFRVSFEFDCVEPMPRELCVLVNKMKAMIEWGRVTVLINGTPAGEWNRSPLDHSWYQADLGAGLRPGRNNCTLVVDYRDYLGNSQKPPCEFLHLPLLYLYGGFRLTGDEELSAPNPCTVAAGSWADQGFPYLSGTARYRSTFELEVPPECQRVWLDLGAVRESARVTLNGWEAYRPWRPFRFDVSEAVRPGENTLDIEVSNTQTNMMFERPDPSGLIGPVRLLLQRVTAQ